MRIVSNEKLIQRRAATARNAITIGILMMIAAAVMSFTPRYVPLAYVSLFISLPLVSWGVNRGERWLGKPRPDQALAKALKGLDHSHQLYSLVLPAEHVLLSPTGLFVLHVKLLDGKISCHGEKWHRQFTWLRLLRAWSEERLGNPSKAAREEAEALRRFIAGRLPDAIPLAQSEVDGPIQPVVVFIHPDVELEVVEPTVPAMPLRDLKTYLRTAPKTLPQETYKALTHLFNEQST